MILEEPNFLAPVIIAQRFAFQNLFLCPVLENCLLFKASILSEVFFFLRDFSSFSVEIFGHFVLKKWIKSCLKWEAKNL